MIFLDSFEESLLSASELERTKAMQLLAATNPNFNLGDMENLAKVDYRNGLVGDKKMDTVEWRHQLASTTIASI